VNTSSNEGRKNNNNTTTLVSLTLLHHSSDAGRLLADEVIEMMKRLKVPNGLKEMGFEEKDIPELVEGTLPQHRYRDQLFIFDCAPKSSSESPNCHQDLLEVRNYRNCFMTA